MQQRFLFVDLDGLLSAVRSLVRQHPAALLKELADADLALNARELTKVLEYEDGEEVAIVCREGTYYHDNAADAETLTADRWKTKKKGALQHPTLDNMLKQTLQNCSDSPLFASSSTKMLVLAAGTLSSTTLSCLELFVQKGWCAQLHLLELFVQEFAAQLEKFEQRYLGLKLGNLLYR